MVIFPTRYEIVFQRYQIYSPFSLIQRKYHQRQLLILDHNLLDFAKACFQFQRQDLLQASNLSPTGTEGFVVYGFVPPTVDSKQSHGEFQFQWFNPFFGTRRSVSNCPTGFDIKELGSPAKSKASARTPLPTFPFSVL